MTKEQREEAFKPTIRKAGYSGPKACIDKGKFFLPECTLKQLEVLDEMKILDGESATILEINIMTEDDFLRKNKKTRSAASLAKNLFQKGYLIKSTKSNRLAYALNPSIFETDFRKRRMNA